MGVKLGFVGSALNSIKHYTNFYNKVSWFNFFYPATHEFILSTTKFISQIWKSTNENNQYTFIQ